MTPRRIYLSAILLLTLSVGTNAQPPKAVLVDEFGEYPCDGFRGRIDGFLSEFAQNSNGKGIVVNSGRGEYELWAVMREEMIRNHIDFRQFDASRISFERTVVDEFKTQFFRVSSSDADSKQIPRNYKLVSISSPVTIEDYDFDDLCPPLNYLHLFGAILEQNPDAQATILVRDRTIRRADARKKTIMKYLIGGRSINAGRLKVFLTEKSDFEYGSDPYVEYRYIP